MSKSGNKKAWEITIIVLLLIFIGLQVYKLIMKSSVSSVSNTVIPTGTPTGMPTGAPTPVSEEPYYNVPTPPTGGSPAALAQAIRQL